MSILDSRCVDSLGQHAFILTTIKLVKEMLSEEGLEGKFGDILVRKDIFQNHTLWEDTWERLDKQIPARRDDGSLEYAHTTLADSVVGQCWAYEKDSYAMWRINSPNKQGAMIENERQDFFT